MVTREATVAGAFYPGKKEKLTEQIEGFFKKMPKEKKTKCVVAPHAGYEYSGQTAAFSYNALKESKTFILLGPSHTGLGPNISISDAEEWTTPLGKLPVDAKLREKLVEKLGIETDDTAHIQEHSIEVQLPFLQFLFKGFSILPITIMEHRLQELTKLGKALAELPDNASIIASGDFTHHQPLETAKEKDLGAIEKVKELDTEGFYNEVVGKNLSICGLAPITVLMQYCKLKNFKEGKLFHYDTSATASGDSSSVVGYAAIGFY